MKKFQRIIIKEGRKEGRFIKELNDGRLYVKVGRKYLKVESSEVIDPEFLSDIFHI